MAGERHDFRRRPVGARHGLPQTQYPTPNVNDVIIIEDVDLSDTGYSPLLPGTPHPNDPSALLVSQGPHQGDSGQSTVRRIYASNRSAQDAYNAAVKYQANSADHPVYIRSYVLPRLGYTPATKGQPLKSLIGIQVAAGGTSTLQNGRHDLTFSGGGGSGATGVCETIDGVIVAAWITDGGAGYTSAPTVTVTGVTDATLTALLQSQSAVLADEEAEPAGDQLSSLFLRITRVYKTMPGPITAGLRWDADRQVFVKVTKQERLNTDTEVTSPTMGTGSISLVVEPVDTVTSIITRDGSTDGQRFPATTRIKGWDAATTTPIYEVTRYVDTGATPPDGNTLIDGRYVIDVKQYKVNDAEDIQIILTMALPASYVTYRNMGFQFPAIFKFANNYTWNTAIATRFPPPWPGDTDLDGRYFLEAHRQGRFPAQEIHLFTLGPVKTAQEGWVVETPGVMSRYFRIPPNCIHDAFTITERVYTDSSHLSYTDYVVEDIPASTPNTYQKGDIIVMPPDCHRYRGNIFETIITKLSEKNVFLVGGPNPTTKLVYIFGLRDINSGFTQMGTFGKPFVRAKTSVGVSVKLYGYSQTNVRGGSTVNIPAGLDATKEYIAVADNTIGALTSMSLLTNPPTTSIDLIEQGDIPGIWRLQPDSLPADGDTLTLTAGAWSLVYTFKTVPAVLNEIQVDAGWTLDEFMIILAQAFQGHRAFDPATVPDPDGITWATITKTVTGTTDITDAINCDRTLTLSSTGSVVWGFTQLQAGLDGGTIATWGAAETLPATKINALLLNQEIQDALTNERGVIDPYVKGECTEVAVLNKAVVLRYRFSSRTNLTVEYRYKVADVYNAWASVGSQTARSISIPQTTAVQLRITNGSRRIQGYAAVEESIPA